MVLKRPNDKLTVADSQALMDESFRLDGAVLDEDPYKDWITFEGEVHVERGYWENGCYVSTGPPEEETK